MQLINLVEADAAVSDYNSDSSNVHFYLGSKKTIEKHYYPSNLFTYKQNLDVLKTVFAFTEHIGRVNLTSTIINKTFSLRHFYF